MDLDSNCCCINTCSYCNICPSVSFTSIIDKDMNLNTPITQISRVYKMYARRLEKLGIIKLEDFLYHVPFRYDDYRLVSKISDVQPGEVVTIQGNVIDIKNQYARRFTIQKAKIDDGSGVLDVIWFNQPYIAKTITIGDKVSLSGKIKQNSNKIILESPDFEVVNDNQAIHTARLVPVYPETRGVSSKWFRRQVYKILNDYKGKLTEFLPEDILEKDQLLKFEDAIVQIHFPDNLENAEKARERLSFNEFFLLHLSSLFRKKEWESELSQKPFSVSKFKTEIDDFLQKLPFELTNAQRKVMGEIFADLVKPTPMNRLLQGEVGSGKTVVATIAMFVAYFNGYKSILMAPTEILANQHFETVSKLLSPFKIKVNLVTGGKKSKDKNYDVLIGTHALLYQNYDFKNLGLVVIDEQQRFGVEQRSMIRKKGESPNFLTMTATPIPRTVALTLYGNLSLSYLDEMPKERKKVKTWLIPSQKREAAYTWIERQIKENGDQAFIICPFIEQSESLVTVKAATKEFERLKKSVFPKLKLGLLHGRLKSKEKGEVLKKFKDKTLDILVATPVVEVGIDIPNATIMLIEEAERFGLAQLHQLRGRVGRGSKSSYCLLFTQTTNPKTIQRLKSLETLYNGAELAELDLRLRGPGQLFGTMQHGIPELKVASFSNLSLIEKTRKEAENIFPKLKKYPMLYNKVRELNIQQVSPD